MMKQTHSGRPSGQKPAKLLAPACALLAALLLIRAALFPVPEDRTAHFTAGGYACDASPIAVDASGPVDINTDKAADLRLLPGIGAQQAERIIAERLENGSYCYPEDLLAARGIGAAKLDEIRRFIYIMPGQTVGR